MKFSMIDNFVEITYRDKSVRYDVTSLKRSKIFTSTSQVLFDEINNYIAGLPELQQYKLFNIYEKIDELWSDYGVAYSVIQKETALLVKELFEIIDLEKLNNFAIRDAGITYPKGLISRDSPEEMLASLNPNINYFLEDYRGLTVLVLALRLMVPIWGVYLSKFREDAGTVYKEYMAHQLLKFSALNSHPYMDRLRLYIDEWKETSTSRVNITDDVAVIDGISSDSLTEYLLGQILVRRISITNLSASNEKDSIISNVHSYLKSKLTEAAANFRVATKFNDSDASMEQGEEISLLEKYKISSKLTHGDRVFIKEYVRNPVLVAQHIDSEIDLYLLEECLETNHGMDFLVEKHNRILTQWVTGNVFPPQGFFELNRYEVINLISIAQALLIKWKFYELALIITAETNKEMINAITTTKMVLKPELLSVLDTIYPHQRVNRRQNEKANLIHEVINNFTLELSSKAFKVRPPPPQLLNVLKEVQEPYVCTLNIINELAELLIMLNNSNRGV